MRIFGIKVETKKELRMKIQALTEALDATREDLAVNFPLYMGATVYDIQLRGDNGKYTKTKASKEHSLINEVVVDTKNYFKLAERYRNYDVFLSYADALARLDEICIK